MLLKPLLKAIGAGTPRPWLPDQLFRGGEVGVWYDPSDLSTLFQDAAGTTPVTGVEQPVGLMLDKSGNGFNASQSTAAARPVLRQDGSGNYYLAFDGIDDYMIIGGLTTGITPITAHFGYVTNNGETVGNQRLMDIESRRSILYASVSSGIGYFDGSVTSADINTEALTVATFNLSSAGGVIRVNASQVVSGSWSEGVISGAITIGSSFAGGAGLLNGRIYQVLVRAKKSADAEIQRSEVFVAIKTGVTL